MTTMRFKDLLSILALVMVSPAAAEDWLKQAAKGKLRTFDGTTPTAESDTERQQRGKVVIRRIKPQCKVDWNTDPTALPYFFYQLRERTQGKFPCYLDNNGISLLGNEIYDYPIIYFTSHYPFKFTDEEVENLKKYLARGGTLWLDDCTGSGPFMDSVPANVQLIVPGSELYLMLREEKAFFDLFNMIYPLNGYPKMKEQFMKPFQAAYLNGRPAILFCPNDYGCSWEVATQPTALNPLGNPAHADPTPMAQEAREGVYQICINWLFYTLTH
ncbi:MAG: DUF4159 domain-containing protein [Planctomycetes bacterium]|nr:DUF4159 domain-containing protein [Planctomycetota bacterium]